MDEIDIKANALLTEAMDSYLKTVCEFGDKWTLSEVDSVKAWLRGFNANEHNNKLYNKTLDLVDLSGKLK